MYNAVLHECRDYEYDKVKEIIKKSIDELGGIGKFVNKGERVLIKPNLIMMKAPDKAATTHPLYEPLPSLLRRQAERLLLRKVPETCSMSVCLNQYILPAE